MSMNHANLDTAPSPLRSAFADDAEMADLIQFFVNEMDQRITNLRAACEAGDMQRLHRLAHQLKGAAGGYGFTPITESAAVVDGLLKDDPTGVNQAEAITKAADELIAQCGRVSL